MLVKKIPTTVITGFLGAGKTSLIRNLMNNINGKKIALIINEFGDIGIDREILTGCGDEFCDDKDNIVELPNGCICCTVADEFLPVMETLLEGKNKPDHIVIETSGLALPKPLVTAFNWPEIRHQVTVDGVITVVDGPAVLDGRFADNPSTVDKMRLADEMLDHESPILELFEDQLMSADLVIINKSDQLSKKDQETVIKIVKEPARVGVSVILAEHANVPPSILLGLEAKAESDLKSRDSHHDNSDDHEHDEFESFVIEMDFINEIESFEMKLKEIIRNYDLLRVKGFLNIHGKERRHAIQAVGPRIDRYYDRDWEENEKRISTLVIIGKSPLDRKAIKIAFGV
ncbi:MAG: cobalamin biosynthesis protein CobW [Alphaproteobacteria bacterium]|nr:cobalamin biosynthesis protein CobW [Alphaproteobacteria bacterium]|tara:strand:- start:15812 stop:16846 length:1035 start_codon:yes stop_codon:yes gene_type:complete